MNKYLIIDEYNKMFIDNFIRVSALERMILPKEHIDLFDKLADKVIKELDNGNDKLLNECIEAINE